jgi:hypothetical protein
MMMEMEVSNFSNNHLLHYADDGSAWGDVAQHPL